MPAHSAPPTVATASPTLAAIDRMLEIAREEARSLEAQAPSASAPSAGGHPPRSGVTGDLGDRSVGGTKGGMGPAMGPATPPSPTAAMPPPPMSREAIAQSAASEQSPTAAMPPPPMSRPGPAMGPATPPSPINVPQRLEDLDLVVSRLSSIRQWLTQDPRLIPLVDDYIGQQVRAMEVRQSRQNLTLAVVTTVVGAILGWLVSLAGTPLSLLHLFGH